MVILTSCPRSAAVTKDSRLLQPGKDTSVWRRTSTFWVSSSETLPTIYHSTGRVNLKSRKINLTNTSILYMKQNNDVQWWQFLTFSTSLPHSIKNPRHTCSTILGNDVPGARHWGIRVEVELHASSALVGSGQLHAPAALSPSKCRWYPPKRKSGGPAEPVRNLWTKKSYPDGNRHNTSGP